MRNRYFLIMLILSTLIFGIKGSFLHAQDTTPCSSKLTSPLEHYQWAKTTPGTANNVRLQPGLQAEIIGQIPEETLFRVLDGPVCADSIIWWQVETEGSALRGWMAEGVDSDLFVVPLDETSASGYRELVRMGRGTIETMAWRPDGKALLVAGSRGVSYYTDELELIGYWDQLAGNEPVFSIAWHPDGRRFVTAGGIYGHDWEEGTLRTWDAFTGMPTERLDTNTAELMNISSKEISLGWNPEGNRLFSMDIGQSSQNGFRIWDTTTQQLLLEVPPRQSYEGLFYPGSVKSVAWSSERHNLLILECSYDSHKLSFWNTVTGKQVGGLEPGQETECLNGDWNPLLAGWSPDSTQIVTAGLNADRDQYVLQIWNTASNELLLTIPVPVNPFPVEKQYEPDPFWVVWSNDGRHLISVNADASVRTWDAQTGNLINTVTLQGQATPLRVISWQPDQNKLATSDIYHTLRVWDAHSGELLSTRLEHTGRSIIFASWSPDGTHIATVSQIESVYSEGSRIHVWNAATGEVERSIDSDNRTDVFWSADGSKLFSGVDRQAHLVWDARTGELLRTIEDTADLWAFLREPEGSRNIDASNLYYERYTKGEDVLGSEGLRELMNRDDYFQPTWIMPNAAQNRIAIVPYQYGADIQIYDLPSLEKLAQISHHHVGFENSEIIWLEWSPDDKRLLSAGLDGTLRIWGLPGNDS